MVQLWALPSNSGRRYPPNGGRRGIFFVFVCARRVLRSCAEFEDVGVCKGDCCPGTTAQSVGGATAWFSAQPWPEPLHRPGYRAGPVCRRRGDTGSHVRVSYLAMKRGFERDCRNDWTGEHTGGRHCRDEDQNCDADASSATTHCIDVCRDSGFRARGILPSARSRDRSHHGGRGGRRRRLRTRPGARGRSHLPGFQWSGWWSGFRADVIRRHRMRKIGQ